MKTIYHFSFQSNFSTCNIGYYVPSAFSLDILPFFPMALIWHLPGIVSKVPIPLKLRIFGIGLVVIHIGPWFWAKEFWHFNRWMDGFFSWDPNCFPLLESTFDSLVFEGFFVPDVKQHTTSTRTMFLNGSPAGGRSSSRRCDSDVVASARRIAGIERCGVGGVMWSSHTRYCLWRWIGSWSHCRWHLVSKRGFTNAWVALDPKKSNSFWLDPRIWDLDQWLWA